MPLKVTIRKKVSGIVIQAKNSFNLSTEVTLMNRICLIVCWFGKLPEYMPAWIKSCSYNKEIDFILITDDDYPYHYSQNIIHIPFSKDMFIRRVKQRLISNPSFEVSYRLCDYRPMYGVIFREELERYDYWGYCDIDVIFGRLSHFLPVDDIYSYEAIFNGGHFTLIQNREKMNKLFMSDGALFDYKTVMKKHAVFAFDEMTGIQRIAKHNEIKAKYGIPYIETEIKYKQLRSRLDSSNPDHQAYYWEKGDLIRVKTENDTVFFQEIPYIHLQKRKIKLLDDTVIDSDSFWITPGGYRTKINKGLPSVSEIDKANPYEGERALVRQEKEYKKMKICQILRRTPFQIYVRLKQQKAGINSGDGARSEMEWKR